MTDAEDAQTNGHSGQASVVNVEPSGDRPEEAKVAAPSQPKEPLSKPTPNKKPKKKAAKKTAKKTAPPERPFPRETLEKALAVAYAIKEKNGGKPWRPGDVAIALDVKKGSSSFFYRAAAAIKYGLTEGGRDAQKIELTELGRELVYAPSPEAEHQLKVKAFFSVETFKAVFEHFNGSTLPEMQYLGNTLTKDFGLDPSVHEEFVKVYTENCKFLGLDGTHSTASKSANKATDGSVVTVADPAKGEGISCFVIMPFSDGKERPEGFFQEVLTRLIAPAAQEVGFTVQTARQQGSDVIQATIVNNLHEADLVVADLTDHNPNVLFELGIRMMTEKPVALIRAKGTSAIFDVDNMLRVAEYDPRLWPSTIRDDLGILQKHLEGAWEVRTTKPSLLSILKSTPQVLDPGIVS